MKLVRRKKGITQDMLSEMTGITQEQLSLIERGVVRPRKKSRKKIESVLGLIDWSEVSGITLQAGYSEAIDLTNKLLGIMPVLSNKERRAIKNLISKYTNK